jgi:hypothetical protein
MVTIITPMQPRLAAIATVMFAVFYNLNVPVKPASHKVSVYGAVEAVGPFKPHDSFVSMPALLA